MSAPKMFTALHDLNITPCSLEASPGEDSAMKKNVVLALNWYACFEELDRLKCCICNICDSMPSDENDDGPNLQFLNKGLDLVDDFRKAMREELLPILKTTGHEEVIEMLEYEI